MASDISRAHAEPRHVFFSSERRICQISWSSVCCYWLGKLSTGPMSWLAKYNWISLSTPLIDMQLLWWLSYILITSWVYAKFHRRFSAFVNYGRCRCVSNTFLRIKLTSLKARQFQIQWGSQTISPWSVISSENKDKISLCVTKIFISHGSASCPSKWYPC